MSVIVDTVNSFFGHSPAHRQYEPYDDAPRTHNMSSTGRRASSSSATSTTQQQPARPSNPLRSTSQGSQPSGAQPFSTPLAGRAAPSSETPQTSAQSASTPTTPAADTRQARPRKIKVRDLEHIQSFATQDVNAFSEIRSRSGSRSRTEGDDSPQYEISEMKVEHIIEMVAGLLTKITTTNDQQHEHLHRQPPHLESASHLNPQTNSVLAFHGKNVPSITILSYLSRINKYCPTSYEVFLSLLVYFDRMTEKVNAGPMQSLRQANEAAMEYNRSASASSESLASDKMEGVIATTPQGTQTVTPPASGNLEKATQEGRPGTPHSKSFQPESPTIPAEPSSADSYNLSHFFVVDSFNIHRLVIAGVTCASKFFSDIFYTNSRYAKVGGLPLPELNHLELQFLLLNDFRLSVPVEEIEAYGTMLVEFYAREIVAQDKAAQAQAMQARSLSESSSDMTLHFHDEPTDGKVPSPPESPRVEKRKSATLDLPTRTSAVSLRDLTSDAVSEELFGTPTAEHQKRLSAKLGDPRALLHSDPEVAAFAAEFFNQPRSRAGPPPSGSILDFNDAYTKLQEQKAREASKKARSPTAKSPSMSRAGSSERDFESKTWTVEASVQGNGGLWNAMRAAAQSRDIELLWIGTLGFPTDALPHSTKESVQDHLLNEYHSEVVYLSDKDASGHYEHYCKTILWTILHYQVPDHPRSKAYADHSWEFYRNVNQAFADKVVDNYKKGDTIWIHDYHLMLVPAMIRKERSEAQIGFFLHTAFPSSEIFRCLANRKTLLEGMLGANLVAFQNDEYVQHFLQTCSRLLTVETTAEGVQLEDRFVNVMSQPIGINPAAISEARQAEEVRSWVEKLLNTFKGKKLLVARDKLDNIHGIRQKLLAYERFLESYPEWANCTVLIQVATGTHEQNGILSSVQDIYMRIRQKFGSLAESPLVFHRQDIDFSQYLGLLTAADVFIISCLRDGMGLTAHDFIICQDGETGGKKHSPLLLSEFAGSASLFEDHIAINPWDFQRMADAMKRALEMSEAEKEQRWSRLHNVVLQQTGGHWAGELGKMLTTVSQEQKRRDSQAVPRLPVSEMSGKYESARRRLFLIDYEGTLTSNKTGAGISFGQPHRIVDILDELMEDEKNIVYVMSGLRWEELDHVFDSVEGLGLIAENGCLLREHGQGPKVWRPLADLEDVKRWKEEFKPTLKYYKERMNNSRIDERLCSLIFDYAQVEDQATAVRQAGECAEQINAAHKDMHVSAVPVSKALIIEQNNVNKATAAQEIINSLREQSDSAQGEVLDFLMVAGNDRDDEVVFRYANDLGKNTPIRDIFTVSVGKRNTAAQASLPQGSTALVTVLEKLAKQSLEHVAGSSKL